MTLMVMVSPLLVLAGVVFLVAHPVPLAPPVVFLEEAVL